MIKYPSIEQFRSVIGQVNRHYNFTGLDETGEPIYDTTLPKPVISFKFTTKVHGSNGSMCYNNKRGLWAQSRENVVTPTPSYYFEVGFEGGGKCTIEKDELFKVFANEEAIEAQEQVFKAIENVKKGDLFEFEGKYGSVEYIKKIETGDNAGFAFFIETNKEVCINLCKQVAEKENIDLNDNTITIYGEWAGQGIHKGVGVCRLPKSFYIFGVKVSPNMPTFLTKDEATIWQKENPSYWVDYTHLRSNEHRIYNIDDFGFGFIDIDFNMPQLSTNKLIELTVAVEDECPVAKHFGFPNEVGEGIVLTATHNGSRYMFKSKGEKHSASKVKTLNAVDTEKLSSIVEFVEYAATENRFQQALDVVFPNNEPRDVKKLGDVIRWVINDITKEELDTMAANNLEPKDLNKYVAPKIRNMFFALPVSE